jgi:hypothetical protein
MQQNQQRPGIHTIITCTAGGATRASPPYFLAGEPGAPLSFADSLREQRDLVARHPDPNRIYPRLKPWLSADGVEPFTFWPIVLLEKHAHLRLGRMKAPNFFIIYLVMPVPLYKHLVIT